MQPQRAVAALLLHPGTVGGPFVVLDDLLNQEPGGLLDVDVVLGGREIPALSIKKDQHMNPSPF